MREIQRKYYVPNNSVLIVTGDVTPDSVFALAEKTYGDWQQGRGPVRRATRSRRFRRCRRATRSSSSSRSAR